MCSASPSSLPHARARQAVLTLCVAAALACACSQAAGSSRDEQRALAAVQAGRALPLATLLAQLEAQLPGRAVDIELEHDDGLLVYEITWLLPDRRVLKLDLDAATGAWLALKGQALETVFRRAPAALATQPPQPR